MYNAAAQPLQQKNSFSVYIRTPKRHATSELALSLQCNLCMMSLPLRQAPRSMSCTRSKKKKFNVIQCTLVLSRDFLACEFLDGLFRTVKR